MTGQIDSFELDDDETSASASASASASSIRYVLLLDDSGRRTSWHRHVWTSLRSRTSIMTLVGILIVAVVGIIATRSGSQEEQLPTMTSVGLDPLGGDEESTTTSFLIGDIRSVGTCQCFTSYGDLGFLPFGDEIDRIFCEEEMEHDTWSESLEYSEVLRCYNVTHRWCFINELPEDFFDGSDIAQLYFDDFDDDEYDSFYSKFSSCLFQFYDHGGTLYSASGQRMPEAFNSKCSDKLESERWHTVLPLTGCGKDYRYRFCDKQGNVDWAMVNAGGPFNCREFNAIDFFQNEILDRSGMEGLCKEQAIGCTDIMQFGCKDGKYDPGENGVGERACKLTSQLLNNLVWGNVNDKGEDLICVP